jgi:hypothetical protein
VALQALPDHRLLLTLPDLAEALLEEDAEGGAPLLVVVEHALDQLLDGLAGAAALHHEAVVVAVAFLGRAGRSGRPGDRPRELIPCRPPPREARAV